jgi:hypothetical protein
MYLIAFYNLKAILSPTRARALSPSFFAVSAFLKSARVFQFLKGEADNGCIRASEVKATFCCISGGREYVNMDLPGPFLVFSV